MKLKIHKKLNDGDWKHKYVLWKNYYDKGMGNNENKDVSLNNLRWRFLNKKNSTIQTFISVNTMFLNHVYSI